MALAVNDYFAGYQKNDVRVAKSNVTNAMIASERVSVGGDIWIDANDDGLQNDPNYTDYAIVQELLYSLNVRLLINDGPESDRVLNLNDDEMDPTWLTSTNFLFEGTSAWPSPRCAERCRLPRSCRRGRGHSR